MKIKTVNILNFKNFEGSHTFNLNENINILYAENGFGKSTFFDALEWCLTGEINRFNEYDEFNDEDIINYNVNEYIHNCSVKIEFSNGSIERCFNVENLIKKGKTQVKVNYRDEKGRIIKLNGKKNINHLIKNKDCLGVNSLTNIKQTHILSQDQITNFINSENPKDRYQSLLSIMGIENKILIDNLKNINKKLNQNVSELQDKVLEYKNKQQYILDKKKIIDKDLLIKRISNLNLLEIKAKEIIELIRKNETIFIEEIYLDNNIKDKLKLEIIKYKEQLLMIDKIEVNKYKNIRNFKKDNDETIEKLSDLKYKMKTSILNKSKLEKNISEISKKEKQFKNIVKIKGDIKSKVNEIEKIKISIEDIKNYNILNKELEKISYAIKHKPEIEKNEKIIKKLIDEKNKLHKEIEQIIEYQDCDKKIVTDIEKSLSKSSTNHLVDMIDSLEKIKISFISKENINTCPVCSSNIQNIDIINEIDKNINGYKEIAFKLEGMSKELILSRESLLEKINLSNRNLKQLKKKLNTYTDNIEDLTIKIKNIAESRLYEKELINADIKVIRLTEAYKKTKIEDINKYKKLKKEIEDLEEIYKEDLELINDESENIGDILEKLKLNLVDENKEILEMKELEERLELTLKSNNEIVYRLDKSILDKKFDKDINELKVELDAQIKYLENKVKEIEEIYITLESYSFNIDRDREIKELKKVEESYSKKASLIIEKSENIKSYIYDLNTYSKECIEKYLNNSESPVKKYYNYLNPMPNKQSLHFNTSNEEEKLLIEIKYNEKSITRLANKTLSSGQLNVLALSIFLAMNEHQKMNDLNMIAIDDPIQNMDDINQFSVCDILGSIQKQMIFSTHDIEFLKLFLKKNSFKKGNITIFNFKSPYLTSDKVKIIDNN
ncbi:AAA family ATPase [Romboutsia sedimentorum]|uniref:Nuclease SbcCD subunit C n=1 Tax=Romboutsia sedimentorum TaxID=1368474 RepID=A0ABT7EAI7_9FIRM|nr:AAA family ATPase [Romboutsia sedimentorum]MDK2563930.1 AAA family ATPase [Romboutsia sedimentorum]